MREANHRARILIVDDDIGFRESLEHLLMDEYDVKVSRSYDEAISAISKELFDLAIIDIRLEHSSFFNVEGLGILRKMIQERPEALTIVLTGYRDNLREEIFTMFPPDLILQKGSQFDAQSFKNTIGELLESKNTEGHESMCP